MQIGINQDPENADTALPDNQEENQCERFFYVAQDSNYNVLGVVYNTGVLCERYEYTPYGRRTTYSRGWILADLNDDGAVDSADAAIESGVHNTTNPPHRADLNGDGVINISDFSLLAAATGQSIAAADPTVMHPRVGAGSFRGRIAAGNPTPLCDVGHQGLMHDEEFDLVYNRARMLVPSQGRFGARDPLEYVDGMNLEEYVRSRVIHRNDPTGACVAPKKCSDASSAARYVASDQEVQARRCSQAGYEFGVNTDSIDRDGNPKNEEYCLKCNSEAECAPDTTGGCRACIKITGTAQQPTAMIYVFNCLCRTAGPHENGITCK